MQKRTRTTLAIGYFLAATLALVWPLYPTLGNHIAPRVFGLPWSLTYVLIVIAANFAALCWLYLTRAIDRDGAGDG
ncbi:MAG: hypothetical protein R3A51_08235 [Nannocystaceae bacterium]